VKNKVQFLLKINVALLLKLALCILLFSNKSIYAQTYEQQGNTSKLKEKSSSVEKSLKKGESGNDVAKKYEILAKELFDYKDYSKAEEFHSRYVHTVIARIYYCVNKSWSGRITLPELRKSNFLQVVSLLEDEDDINLITDYFSYEHFYVIYCKFWELDKDHDLYISKTDLSRHNDSGKHLRIYAQTLF